MPSAPDVVITPAPKRFGKPCSHHRRQHDRADRDHGRRRRAGHRGEQRAGHHAGQPEAAIPVADHRGREGDHAARDAAMGEEIAGQDEERDRHDLEVLDAGEQLERHRLDRHRGHREQEGQHGEAERDRDRHAGQHQRDQQAEDDQRCSSGDLRGADAAALRSRHPRHGRGHDAAARRCARSAQATCRKRKHIR